MNAATAAATAPASALAMLKQHSIVVADTGDVQSIAQFAPRDATTNPSLILAAASTPAYRHLLDETVAANAGAPPDSITDALLVRFGCEILAHVPGRVSTEIDARLSFDIRASILRARRIIGLYADAGVPRSRVLIKLAATWEGIQAASRLEQEGIACNLTLVFGMPQAVACANAGVSLISPFVGRILDWHKERGHAGHLDPGVMSVAAIYRYYKRFDIRTEIMAASFRTVDQIRALAGCDLLTISPSLLTQLRQDTSPVPRMLSAEEASRHKLAVLRYDENAFRYAMNDDEMACDKLAQGIRSFVRDAQLLDYLISEARR
jgi:transaldolase